MMRLGDLLADALGREDVLRAGRAYAVLRRWDEVVGPHLAKRSRPERLDRGTLWVAVEGSAWAQELRLHAPTVLRKLAALVGEGDLFKEIRCGVRPLPELPEAPPARILPTEQPELERMTIREIAERRLARLEAQDRERNP